MAPSKSRQAKARNVKQNLRNQKNKRRFTRSSSGGRKGPLGAKGLGDTPDGSSHLTKNRQDSPCSISLSNLVRLDWRHRQDLFAHGPGETKLESFGFKGQTYHVESLEPGVTGNKFVYLYPEKRYYVVPIYEEGQAPDAPQRFLLVRSRDDKEEPGPHIFVIEPLELPALDEPFAHLRIIGGADDTATSIPALHTAGIVEAVLTTRALTPEPSTTPSASSSPSTTTPLDEDLFSCIDVLAIAQSARPEVAKDFDAAHNKFLGYVRKRYGLENIPISLGRTTFDPALGHNAATTVNDPALPNGVIVGILRDGYRRDHQIVRDAHVVVNKRDARSDTVMRSYKVAQTEPQTSPPLEAKPPDLEKSDDDKVVRDVGVTVDRVPSRVARLNKLVPLSRKQIFLEISARPDALIDEAILDADKQVGTIDVIYSLLAIFALADPAKVRSLAEQLNNQTATGDSVRKALEQIPSLHIRYLHRTPEMYIALRGAIQPLDMLRQILSSEAAQRSKTNYYLQSNRSWLFDLLRQLRPGGLADNDYSVFANDIARRLEQISFTAEFAATPPK